MTDLTQKNPSLSTPSAIRRWRFGQLSAAELLPHLQRHLLTSNQQANWQLAWLNNDGRAVIGLLPKISWAAYPSITESAGFNDNQYYQVIKTCRDTHISSSYDMSYADWQAELIAYSEQHHAIDNNGIQQTQNATPSYQHGLIGFIGYDIGSQALSLHADIDCAAQPTALLGHYDIYLTAMSNEQCWELHVVSDTDTSIELNSLQSLAIKAVVECLNTLDNELSGTNNFQELGNSLAPLVLTPKWQKSDYQRAFAKTQCYLVQGDCYQINLTQAWQGSLNSFKHNGNAVTNLIDYVPALHRNTQAPFAGYIGLTQVENTHVKQYSNSHINPTHANTVNFELLSCSPELFFTFIKDKQTGTHHIRTKPIKGTRPRSINAEQDLLLKQQLIDSAKDRAENVMIVDLLRNDLGKYAKTGSVKVPQLFTIESFSNVHHMVSTITAELKPNTHPLAVLFGSLPAGSITGTPKKRAVEIISELESTPRGAYCGTMGYINFDGSGQWNVLIRTLQANRFTSGEMQVSLWAGGGITIASDCNEEYQECLDKVGNLLNVLAQSND
ncbi:anthranilate synthase component I family protein [Psychrobacter sp. 16-MNA-CIBAN-0192]|uniref:anthranilate synthase component I family protein n=1 Tax=Psychrobacter sp. 16-MNA-CIBAN-0192 TaxID=3140448 RepID=UPI0033347BE7